MANEQTEQQKAANEAKAQENKQRETKLRERQKVVEPPIPAQTEKRLPADEARTYLEAAGWLYEGCDDDGRGKYQDPSGMGSKLGVPTVTKELPALDFKMTGQLMPLKQTVVPPSSWSYPTQEAVSIQRARDKAEAKKAVA